MPRARHVRFLVFVGEDLAKMRTAVKGSAGDWSPADPAAILHHGFRPDAEDPQGHSDEYECTPKNERLLEHRGGDQLGKCLLGIGRGEYVECEDENDRPEAGP